MNVFRISGPCINGFAWSIEYTEGAPTAQIEKIAGIVGL